MIHHQLVLHPVEVHSIANALQILEDGLESDDPEAHDGRRESRHPDIGAHVDHHPAFTGKLPPEQLLDGLGDVGLAEALALEEAGDVPVRAVGEGAHVGEGVEEGAGHALHEAGEDRRGLRRGVAVEGGGEEGAGWGGGGSGGGEGEIWGSGEDQEEEDESREEEEEGSGRGGGMPAPGGGGRCRRHWLDRLGSGGRRRRGVPL